MSLEVYRNSGWGNGCFNIKYNNDNLTSACYLNIKKDLFDEAKKLHNYLEKKINDEINAKIILYPIFIGEILKQSTSDCCVNLDLDKIKLLNDGLQNIRYTRIDKSGTKIDNIKHYKILDDDLIRIDIKFDNLVGTIINPNLVNEKKFNDIIKFESFDSDHNNGPHYFASNDNNIDEVVNDINMEKENKKNIIKKELSTYKKIRQIKYVIPNEGKIIEMKTSDIPDNAIVIFYYKN